MKSKSATSHIDNHLQTIEDDFKNFVLQQNHPCMMAQTVFSMGDYQIRSYENLGSKMVAKKMLSDIKTYLEGYNFEDNKFETLIATFPTTEIATELEFENLLWRQLQFINEIDDTPWDHRVSPDPENDNFSFSIGGRAFYIIGMHPKSSRKARRAPYPTLVFNLHWQFEKLREMGVYHKVRNKIRERDTELQGGINPMLEDFGESSEARQYSGRAVAENWKCPFHNNSK